MYSIPGQFQHELVVANITRKKIRNVVRKIHAVRRKIGLLKTRSGNNLKKYNNK